MTRPIVLGAGPAGSVAAMLLARAGAEPILIDRQVEVGDAICGGFMSWRTAASLRALGSDPLTLGARPVTRLRQYSGERVAEADLPEPAYGLSRKALDTALRASAVQCGARLEIDRARSVKEGEIEGERRSWHSPAIFLATGKHDVRGEARARNSGNLALGLRVRLPPSSELERLVGDAIELHLFEGGYAGIVLQEGGNGNVCLALRKSALAEAGGDPWDLLRKVATDNPHFASRLALADAEEPVDTIGAVPYGWTARKTSHGIYRLGDQAAVIPSLAGEGMAIALASGQAAARAYLAGESAELFQRRFAQRAARPVRVAEKLWHLAETSRGAAGLTLAASAFPELARLAMKMSRI
ncbi:NAD(P)/FAD-dependent oxidoreductase [Parapontixanthobacter aurantiacus]|nr:FAD-dependent monooxygenase [Parapontixanthobacter aurantiacus]